MQTQTTDTTTHDDDLAAYDAFCRDNGGEFVDFDPDFYEPTDLPVPYRFTAEEAQALLGG